ncbi:MAG: hypothetical protein HY824_00820 [Acidobacteria bacterium]|nr:hypothetical protein [Acidobacteriota bacterium]
MAVATAITIGVLWVTEVPAPGQGRGQAQPAQGRGQAQPAQGRGQAQAPAGGLARTEDGKPNLNGIWQAMTSANWNIEAHGAEPGPHPEIMGAWGAQPGGLGIVEGGTIPYKPEALAQRQANLKNRTLVKITNDPHRFDTGDPELQCFRPGVPRANYMPFPFQIFQTREQILIVYEYKGSHRTVYMDPHLEAPVDSWMGWSNGRWEGDSLVIDVTGFNGHTWFDRAGNFATDTLHVVERFTPKGPNHIMYEATLEDPAVFTRPWKVSFPIYRHVEPNAQLVEFNCVPFVEEMMYTPLGLYNPPNRSSR